MGLILTLLVVAIFIVPIFLARKNNREKSLRPFEFSRNYSSPSTQLSEMSNEKAIVLLFLAWTIPSVISFIIDLYSDVVGYEYGYEFFRPIYMIVGGIANLILLWVCFSVRLSRWKVLIIFMVLFQVFTYIYWNFLRV